jgi:hypothetical protein
VNQNATERNDCRLLRRKATLEGYQGTGQEIFEQIQKGKLRIDELVREVIENEEIRALNYSVPTGEKPDLIQIVLPIQGTDPPTIINTFDFTISRLGTDRRNLYFGPYTWTDLLRKRLRVHHIHYGISTMRRMVKYSHQFTRESKEKAACRMDTPPYRSCLR